MSENEECNEMKRRKSDESEVEWCNLPGDLLSRIATYLEFIDFIRFRVVCKGWNIPPSEYNPSQSELWFLIYGQGSQCSLLKLGSQSADLDRLYTTVNFPELDGATCLASYLGWLLLVRDSEMFFFCPFSRSKIDLPSCPFTELKEHVAAFSAEPTCQDCVVVVVCNSEQELELHSLPKGNKEWRKHGHRCSRSMLNTVSGAGFSENKFQFLDAHDGLVTFNPDGKSSNNSWMSYRIVNHSSSKDLESLEYSIRKNMFEVLNMADRLGLKGSENDNVSISTCGAMIFGIRWLPLLRGDTIILGESIAAAADVEPAARHVKGVWIQPRYVQVPPAQTW
ncbi:hypothetical protein PIB30_040263 [Stylosanthes scabra]|uniref:F-box domain-containing protein n=1 Tax=Stylosanthes scabra TaxID=79078 RepID=A0ABU6WEB7_9FABA|nr:hypothetical protein [Stylosanthes scabra]